MGLQAELQQNTKGESEQKEEKQQAPVSPSYIWTEMRVAMDEMELMSREQR